MNKALWDILLSPVTLVIVALVAAGVFIAIDWVLKKVAPDHRD